MRGKYAELQHELGDAQEQRNELQASLQEEQAKNYQGRQTMTTRHKRLESDLAEASERMTAMELKHTQFRERGEQQLEAQHKEIEAVRQELAQLEQEKAALQESFGHKQAAWEEERHSLALLNSQRETQLQELQREKTTFQTQLEQQQETWERERLSLQIHNNTLEERLSAHQSGIAPPLENEQLRQLQAALEQAQRENTELQGKLVAQGRQMDQERSALEAEIEQLMERLLRLQSQD